MQLKNLPVHRAMREISELIYETCQDVPATQGRFLLIILWVFIGAIVALYFARWADDGRDRAMVRGFPATRDRHLLFSPSESPAATGSPGLASG